MLCFGLLGSDVHTTSCKPRNYILDMSTSHSTPLQFPFTHIPAGEEVARSFERRGGWLDVLNAEGAR